MSKFTYVNELRVNRKINSIMNEVVLTHQDVGALTRDRRSFVSTMALTDCAA